MLKSSTICMLIYRFFPCLDFTSVYLCSAFRQRQRKPRWICSNFTISRPASCTHVRSLTFRFLTTGGPHLCQEWTTILSKFFEEVVKRIVSEIYVSLAERLRKLLIPSYSIITSTAHKSAENSSSPIIIRLSYSNNYYKLSKIVLIFLQPLPGSVIPFCLKLNTVKVTVSSLSFCYFTLKSKVITWLDVWKYPHSHRAQ